MEQPVEAPGLSRYAALAATLHARIAGGEWPGGSALPAETVLAAELGVALGTLRRALELLAAQGLIERRHGRGTFVRSGLAGAPMLRFFRFGERAGEVPHSRILARQVLAAPAEAARALGLDSGAPALRLRRLRSLAGAPRLLEELWLPLPLFATLAADDTAAWPALLYPLFAERCGVHVARAVDDIAFATLAATQARTLGLATGHPCALVTRRAFDLTGRCVEWRQTRGDAQAFHYAVTIT